MQKNQLVFLFLILIASACLIGFLKNHRDIRAGLFGTDAQIMGLVELYGLKPDWKKDCTKEQIKEIFEQATSEKPEIKVHCSLNLKKSKYSQYKNQTITKRLVLEGSRASHVHINCAGTHVEPIYHKESPSLRIHSNPLEESKDSLLTGRSENILIEDCQIRGSVQVGDSNSTNPETAPQKILFDRLVIDSFLDEPCQKAALTESETKIPFHIMRGVHHVNLVNSVIKGFACGLNIKLAPGSGDNVIKNNDIKAHNQKRELVHIKGSGNNVIVDNHFSSLEGGGILLSGNCKAEDLKHRKSQNNLIANNIFDYENIKPGDSFPPAINLSEKSDHFFLSVTDSLSKRIIGKNPENCNSNHTSHNAITHNQITGDRIQKPDPKNMEKVLFKKYLSDNNDPNLFYKNKIVDEVFIYDEPICRGFYGYPAVGISKYGYGPKSSHVCPVCYVSEGFPKRLISQGEELKFNLGRKDFIFPLEKVKICENALLKETKKSVKPASLKELKNYKTYEEFFELTEDHSSQWFYCPNKEKLFAAKILCDLEGNVTKKDLSSVDWNSIKIIKNQDQKGSCALFENIIGTDQKNLLTSPGNSEHKLFGFKYFKRSGGLAVECKTDRKTCFIGVQYLCQTVSGW